jgi:transposase
MPGASVAAVALAGGVNANLLFKWRREHLRSKRLSDAASSSPTVLIPVQVTTGMATGVGRSQPSAPSPASAAMAVVTQRAARVGGTIELDIAGAVLRLRGPVDEVSLCSVLRALRHTA